MINRFLTCIAVVGVFTLPTSMQVSSVSAAITAHVSPSTRQAISTATWRVLPVLTDTATVLQSTFASIKRSSDAGPWTYFSIRNLGHVATTAMDLTLTLTNTTGNPTVDLEWCNGFVWNEVANTCNGVNAGTLLMTVDKRGSTLYTWNKGLAVNGSIRVRLQKTSTGNNSADATLSIEIPRSYVRAGISQQN